ncbi:MAG: 2'-5' RNA ligase family protein [Bifidobacteriales bacterium]|nr:2'-5' RNA ligase family protein [Bifidobacteriales bacterium]
MNYTPPMSFLLALPLSATMQDELNVLRDSLNEVRWLPPAHCMIPLYTLGRITARHALEELDATLSHLPWEPFSITLQEVGHHLGEVEDTLSVGITPKQALITFQKKLSTLLRRAGFASSRRPFIPTMTIARLDPAAPTDLMTWVQRHNLFHSSPMMVDHLMLLEHLHSHGEDHFQLLEQYPTIPSLLLDDALGSSPKPDDFP